MFHLVYINSDEFRKRSFFNISDREARDQRLAVMSGGPQHCSQHRLEHGFTGRRWDGEVELAYDTTLNTTNPNVMGRRG